MIILITPLKTVNIVRRGNTRRGPVRFVTNIGASYVCDWFNLLMSWWLNRTYMSLFFY